MSSCHIVTMDRSGRIVVPKALRERLAVEPGQPLTAQVRDGRLEIEAQNLQVKLVERDGVLVITPTEPVAPLTRDKVRELIEDLRK